MRRERAGETLTTRPALDRAREVHTPLRYVRSRIGGCGVQLVTQAV